MKTFWEYAWCEFKHQFWNKRIRKYFQRQFNYNKKNNWQTKLSKFISCLQRCILVLLGNYNWQWLIFKIQNESIRLFPKKKVRKRTDTCTLCTDVIQVLHAFEKCWPIKDYIINAHFTTLCVPAMKEEAMYYQLIRLK